MRSTIVFLLMLAAGCTTVPREPQTVPAPDGRGRLVNFKLPGTIIKIEDGDTLAIRGQGGDAFNIRLSDIDSPETFHARNPYKDRCPAGPATAPAQRFGNAATASLAAMAPVGSQAIAECYEVDAYGRLVCHVIVNGTNVNAEQVRAGLAMTVTNPKWLRDPGSKIAERFAQERMVGIWAFPNPVPPEKWRKDCWCDGICRESQ